ncbi:hypothetical protein SERLA73DRAFT_187350 [Serpula lacrymans var. lacrymans S7.3]|uniref:Thymidylate kinase n=2 Tax=Serpula lacrymans var. lacrymans TaxID=341189 RepID=F8Q906_SERL3|nr:uncharacterized protein SERLADRAFT_399491 [Serpula lacrymans var. lacrymans S7.9]EGN95061.1 hypothetical protein SERLA73DRAFT_187350 [Serpula lacrymans var. lacrymans S7.3]EGO20550.1 hypothetical protein SERLADRAFT_399491 [Serpula lacrymans var. lacrymans S7.9]
MTRRAPFIVVEGLDRSGKSTQASILCDHLTSLGLPVELFKFPDRRTAIGKMIDSYLRSESDLDDRAIHLLFSANRWELASTISSHLEKGTTIIADRYAFSGIAFSARKGLSYKWCQAPDVGLPAPDLTMFLDIEPDIAQARGGYGTERYEQEEVQRDVRQVFERIEKEMTHAGARWVKIDAGRTQKEVSQDVWVHVQSILDSVHHPVGTLWEEPQEGTLGSIVKV